MRGVWRCMCERGVEVHVCEGCGGKCVLEGCGGVCVKGVWRCVCQRGVEVHVHVCQKCVDCFLKRHRRGFCEYVMFVCVSLRLFSYPSPYYLTCTCGHPKLHVL